MAADAGIRRQLDNPQGWNLYSYVQNNPLANYDPDGMAAIAVTFTNYRVGNPSGSPGRLPLGHAGIVTYDNSTGKTRYFEYGRYGQNGQGMVREPFASSNALPSVSFGSDGRPTDASVKSLLSFLSANAGGGTSVEAALFSGANANSMNQAADQAMAGGGSTSAPYSFMTNNCASFTENMLGSGGVSTAGPAIDVPGDVMGSLQSQDDASYSYDAASQSLGEGHAEPVRVTRDGMKADKK